MGLFPDVELADEDGLLCQGGDLSPRMLLEAYSSGIFPWYSEGGPILWWSPPERMVFFPERVHVSRSLRKDIRKRGIWVEKDADFGLAIRLCAQTPRPGQDGTWIHEEMIEAYKNLARLGFGASWLAWEGREVIGAMYGVAIGKALFAESMCSLKTNGSKAILASLADSGYALADAQFHTPHLESMGGKLISRECYLELLGAALGPKPRMKAGF